MHACACLRRGSVAHSGSLPLVGLLTVAVVPWGWRDFPLPRGSIASVGKARPTAVARVCCVVCTYWVCVACRGLCRAWGVVLCCWLCALLLQWVRVWFEGSA